MLINIQALTQHQNYWTTYGEQFASRWVWNKKTNAELASKMDTKATIQKLRAHDNRARVIRWFVRRFTSIEKQRELLAYKLITQSLDNLTELPRYNTIRINQPLLDVLSAITISSPLSWLKNSIGAFTSWIGKYRQGAVEPQNTDASNQPQRSDNINPQPTQHALPSATHQEQALALSSYQPSANRSTLVVTSNKKENDGLKEFRTNLENHKMALAVAFKLGEEKILQAFLDKDREAIPTCFDDFKKMYKDLQVYYHPDKATEKKANHLGLSLEVFKKLTESAFKELIEFTQELRILKDDLANGMEKNFKIDDQLADLQKGITELNRGWQEVYANLDELEKNMEHYLSNVETYLQESQALINIMQKSITSINTLTIKQNNFMTETTQEISTLKTSVQAINSLLNINPTTNPSTNPAALFSSNNGGAKSQTQPAVDDNANNTSTQNCAPTLETERVHPANPTATMTHYSSGM